MADFCKQCSIRVLGEDYRDMAGITNEEETENLVFAHVLCEGCGPCVVNHLGERVDITGKVQETNG